MTQVPILPPPWGPARDPHFASRLTYEGWGLHRQASAADAALRGWYYRSEWYKRLVPDTRRCVVHGEIMYPALPLSPAEEATFYTDQERGMATGPRSLS